VFDIPPTPRNERKTNGKLETAFGYYLPTSTKKTALISPICVSDADF
jgi:hypothetical protein